MKVKNISRTLCLIGVIFALYAGIMTGMLTNYQKEYTFGNGESAVVISKQLSLGPLATVCDVSINAPKDSESGEAMGSYLVYRLNTEGTGEGAVEILTRLYPVSDGLFEVLAGTEIIIRAIAYDFHEFVGFKQNFPSELYDPVNNPNELKVKVSIDRQFIINFKKTTYNIMPNITSESPVEVGADKIRLDDEIDISINLGTFREIKDLKINGIQVSHSDYVGDVVFSGNVATIKVTKDWLMGYSKGTDLALDIVVVTKLNDILMIVILCLSVAVPAMIAFAIFMIVLGKKQKKLALHSIRVKQAHEFRTNTGGFISDLREGVFTGQVTEKDLKGEIKDQSKK